MNEIWIKHYSVCPWSDPTMWSSYLARSQEVLGEPLSRLDQNDPARRRATSFDEDARFICDFGPGEQWRWIFGRVGKPGIRLLIRHCRDFRDFGGSHNEVGWSVPAKTCETPEGLAMIGSLFALGNEMLNPYYSYSERMGVMARMTEQRGNKGAVSSEQELLGVFWLTFFSSRYIEYFGRERVDELPMAAHHSPGGVTLKAAESPFDDTERERETTMSVLGRKSFVDVTSEEYKPKGKYALTFEQLSTDCR